MDKNEIMNKLNDVVIPVLREYMKSDCERSCPALGRDYRDVQVEVGRKYAKIISVSGGQRSAYAFIDLTNGDVLKPASWAAPAKHARGNIMRNIAQEMMGTTFGPYGVAYLR